MAPDNLLWMKDFLQDDLYLLDADKNIVTEPIPQPVQETIKPIFNCLGRIDSGFVILVDYPDEEHINASHLQSLQNILVRKNIDIQDVTIVNLYKQPDNSHDAILDYFKPDRLLVMGENALPENFPPMQLNSVIIGKPNILYALSFKDMDNNDKKRAFWDVMRNF